MMQQLSQVQIQEVREISEIDKAINALHRQRMGFPLMRPAQPVQREWHVYRCVCCGSTEDVIEHRGDFLSIPCSCGGNMAHGEVSYTTE